LLDLRKTTKVSFTFRKFSFTILIVRVNGPNFPAQARNLIELTQTLAGELLSNLNILLVCAKPKARFIFVPRSTSANYPTTSHFDTNEIESGRALRNV